MCTFYILRFILIWILTQCILILTIFVSTLLQMLYWMSLNLKVRYTFTKRLAKTNKNSPLFLNTYFCYKTITSQNVSLGVQVWNFLFHRKVMFHSRDIQVFVFLIISWITKSVTSWVLVHVTGCIFSTTTH